MLVPFTLSLHPDKQKKKREVSSSQLESRILCVRFSSKPHFLFVVFKISFEAFSCLAHVLTHVQHPPETHDYSPERLLFVPRPPCSLPPSLPPGKKPESLPLLRSLVLGDVIFEAPSGALHAARAQAQQDHLPEATL